MRVLRFVLTFADASSVHHPDEGGAVLAVGGDAVLSGLENVAIVFLHLQGAAESQARLPHWFQSQMIYCQHKRVEFQ